MMGLFTTLGITTFSVIVLGILLPTQFVALFQSLLVVPAQVIFFVISSAPISGPKGRIPVFLESISKSVRIDIAIPCPTRCSYNMQISNTLIYKWYRFIVNTFSIVR
jgi:hypothetical protein